MRDDDKRQLKIELLSQWKLEAEFRKKHNVRASEYKLFHRIVAEPKSREEFGR